MAGRIFAKNLIDLARLPVGVRTVYGKSRIGNRDIVGFGVNGQAIYVDRSDYPMPAIRWKENTSDVMALREKEKGDWKKLNAEEKKALYRASFCQTFAEFEAPTGIWKYYFGWAIGLGAISLWMFMAFKLYVLPPLPESFSEENRKRMLKSMLDMKIDVVTGLSSKWDYENNRWK